MWREADLMRFAGGTAVVGKDREGGGHLGTSWDESQFVEGFTLDGV